MASISKTRLRTAIAIPAIIFLACTCITYSTTYKTHEQQLSIAILIDLLITAPLAYYLVIRKTALPGITVLRVFMLGMLVAGLLVSKSNAALFSFIKMWISPAIELSLLAFIVWKFYKAKKQLGKTTSLPVDFLMHCRALLRSVFNNEQAANILASEVAVFYYSFCRHEKNIPHTTRFTSYKENGVILILSTFLCLFIIETVGMHLVFLLWSKVAAWTLTLLSFYTCIQLFAHIRSLRIRTTMIIGNELLIRNGILGADALVELDNIDKIVETNKLVPGTGIIKMGLLNGLEKNNMAIYLKEPVTVMKAFGIKKKANVILLSIDQREAFIAALIKKSSVF